MIPINQLVGHHIGDYQLTQLLGQGQVNAVYLAQSASQVNPVTLTLFLIPELFSPEERQRIVQRFRTEAGTLLALHHPHILPVLDYREHAGSPCLVTPSPVQSSLPDVLKQQGNLNLEDVQKILEQVAAALDTAHSKGVIHGLLKPAHLLLKDRQTVLVAGFGWLNMLQLHGIRQHPQARILSLAGTPLIVPEYAAPEVLAGQPPDPSSDIYALGVILRELLSSAHPLPSKTSLDGRGPSLSSAFPSGLESVVMQALNSHPAQRFQSASDMVDAFKQAVGVRSETQRATQSKASITAQHQPTGRWQIVPPIVTLSP